MQSARPGRRAGLVVVGVLVGAALLWSALWWLAANRAGAGLDDWVTREAAQGRQWTCPDRQISGYPFELHIVCNNPTFKGEVAGRAAAGTLRTMTAMVEIGQPRTLLVEATGPLNLHSEQNDDFNLMISWDRLHLRFGDLPGVPSHGSVETTRLAVTLSTPQEGDLNIRAARLAGEAAPATGADTQTGDEAFGFSAEGLSLPTVDIAVGGNDPVNGEGNGVLRHADILTVPSWAQLDAWRQAGGRLDVASFRVAKGGFSGQASGHLALDEEHRPAGQLDMALSGFEPIARRFGIPIAGVKLGGLLTSLLGGKKAGAPPSQNGEVRLPLVLNDGRLLVGPFETPVRLRAFY